VLQDNPDGTPSGLRGLSETMQGFLESWQPRQRRTAGYQAVLFRKIDNLRLRPEWAEYDVISHTLGALHAIIEGHRLIGGQARSQVVADLIGLIRFERPDDSAPVHRGLAHAIIDLLVNAKGRQLRYRDDYMHVVNGAVTREPLSFALVETIGEDDALEPRLRPTIEAINIFQNFFTFDPSDRAAAERYRSERMLKRKDYDEVLHSVERRRTSVHGLRGEIELLLRRIRHCITDIDYGRDVIPRLDEALELIDEQIAAEEQFSASVERHMHPKAPDLARLRRVSEHLGGLIHSLIELHGVASSVRREFEAEQDRQLFTQRRMTISPQSDLLGPLLERTLGQIAWTLPPLIGEFRGARAPQVVNLQALMDHTAPRRRAPAATVDDDPFDPGELDDEGEQFDPRILGVIALVLAEVDVPVALSALLGRAVAHPAAAEFSSAALGLLEWAMALTVAGAYGCTDEPEQGGDALVFDHSRLAVLNRAVALDHPRITGDDLLVVPVSILGG
jgi:hypothetical protein